MVWLERSALRARAKHLKPATLNDANALAVRIWNAMKGIDFAALPILAAYHSVLDIERLLDSLMALQEYQRMREQQ